MILCVFVLVSDIVYLYVINTNSNKKETVEKFRFDQRRIKLYHLRTFEGDPTFIQWVSLKHRQQLQAVSCTVANC